MKRTNLLLSIAFFGLLAFTSCNREELRPAPVVNDFPDFILRRVDYSNFGQLFVYNFDQKLSKVHHVNARPFTFKFEHNRNQIIQRKYPAEDYAYENELARITSQYENHLLISMSGQFFDGSDTDFTATYRYNNGHLEGFTVVYHEEDQDLTEEGFVATDEAGNPTFITYTDPQRRRRSYNFEISSAYNPFYKLPLYNDKTNLLDFSHLPISIFPNAIDAYISNTREVDYEITMNPVPLPVSVFKCYNGNRLQWGEFTYSF